MVVVAGAAAAAIAQAIKASGVLVGLPRQPFKLFSEELRTRWSFMPKADSSQLTINIWSATKGLRF